VKQMTTCSRDLDSFDIYSTCFVIFYFLIYFYQHQYAEHCRAIFLIKRTQRNGSFEWLFWMAPGFSYCQDRGAPAPAEQPPQPAEVWNKKHDMLPTCSRDLDIFDIFDIYSTCFVTVLLYFIS
jgi:hypothetical protein